MFGHGAVVRSRVHRAQLVLGSASGREDFGMGSGSKQKEVPLEVLLGSVEDVDKRMRLDDRLVIDG